MPSGGLEVLLELSYLGRIDRVIIITQYPEVEIEGKLVPLAKVSKEIKTIIDVNLLGVIQFDKYTTNWKKDIANKIGGIEWLPLS